PSDVRQGLTRGHVVCDRPAKRGAEFIAQLLARQDPELGRDRRSAVNRPPLTLRMHERDNVAIVANDGGLLAGTVLADGVTLRERVPRAHKVALVDIPTGEPVLRYNVTIGHALRDIAAGSWVHEGTVRVR